MGLAKHDVHPLPFLSLNNTISKTKIIHRIVKNIYY